MEVYEAKYDYVRERDDVLSFTKGEKFHITSKTNEKWWAAKKVSDNSHGYVPSVYLQPCQEKVIGRLLPEGRLDTKEHRIHLQALAEIHKKVKPLPVPTHTHTGLRLEGLARDKQPSQHARSLSHKGVPVGVGKTPSPTSPTLPTPPPMSPNRLPSYKKHSWPHSCGVELPPAYNQQPLHHMSPPPMASPPPPDYDMGDSIKDQNDMPFHHMLNSSGRFSSLSSEESNDRSPTSPGGDDAFQIKPKPLPNPVKDSREHKQLHRELRMSYKSGNVLPQKPELMVVHRERKLEEKRKEQLREQKSRRTSMEIKLLERQEKERVEEEKEQRMMKMKENEAIAEERKPEFMKVRLKQTNSLPRS
ncbi:bromodomain-containing protein 4-like isoform X1 [Asterias rubens]|uniref:bromodomain-containing protein 4-like isoform X1 n=1 Tax=Asterias rubens TaxID=7604 RepID=UPI0014553996|nr:bromodomain-containing protein 4-like isoform X1 [Asterias rubens]